MNRSQIDHKIFTRLWPAVFFLTLSVSALEKPEERLLKQFTFRNLGPFRAGSWE